MTIETRELKSDEFYLAEKLWEQYHGQKADPGNERIFGVFVEDSGLDLPDLGSIQPKSVTALAIVDAYERSDIPGLLQH